MVHLPTLVLGSNAYFAIAALQLGALTASCPAPDNSFRAAFFSFGSFASRSAAAFIP